MKYKIELISYQYHGAVQQALPEMEKWEWGKHDITVEEVGRRRR